MKTPSSISHAYTEADPTSFSWTTIPEWIPIYERGYHDAREIHFSLLCGWIVNVCQLVRDVKGRVASIPLAPQNIREILTLSEVLADLVLIEALSSSSDRDILLQDERRDTHGEKISSHNCRIFPSGSYSAFDICCVEMRLIPQEEILEALYKTVQNLCWVHSGIHVPASFFYHSDLLDTEFGKRIVQVTTKFLERYDSAEGKIFFLRQRQYSEQNHTIPEETRIKMKPAEDFFYPQDEKDYTSFIGTLQNIRKVFRENPCALNGYILGKKVRQEEIRYHFDALITLIGTKWINWDILRQYFQGLIKSVLCVLKG